MNLSQKKTCEGCRAMAHWQKTGVSCELGYNNAGPMIPAFGMRRAVPQEPCPKPKTIDDFLFALNHYKKG